MLNIEESPTLLEINKFILLILNYLFFNYIFVSIIILSRYSLVTNNYGYLSIFNFYEFLLIFNKEKYYINFYSFIIYTSSFIQAYIEVIG